MFYLPLSFSFCIFLLLHNFIIRLRHYEWTNENVSYFLTNQSKRKTSIDIKVTRKPKPTKNNTRPYLNEIPTHFIHEIKTKGYDVIGVNLLLPKLMKFLPKNRRNRSLLYYCFACNCRLLAAGFTRPNRGGLLAGYRLSCANSEKTRARNN